MFTSQRPAATRPFMRLLLSATAAIALGLAAALPAKAQDTIKVGILHSLSGTMAISETTLKDVMLMLIEEQNKKGGLLGKKLEVAAVRRESARADHQGEGRRGLRLLDLGVAQVRAAGVQGAQLDPVLSGAV
jgi:hypothetical protein